MKHLKKADEYISWNIVNLIMKMKTLVWILWVVKIYQISSQEFRQKQDVIFYFFSNWRKENVSNKNFQFGVCAVKYAGRPGFVIPKTLKSVLDTYLHNTQQYNVPSRIKWSNPGKGVAPSSTPQCRSYWNGSLLVALDYSCQQLYTRTNRPLLTYSSILIILTLCVVLLCKS